MRCPKCGFITFDHAVSCSKCNTDLQSASGGFQGTSANVKPPSLLGSVTKQAPEPSVDDLLEGQGLEYDNSSADNEEESLDLLSGDDLDVTGDLSDIDLNELSPQAFDSDDIADDEIPSLEPLSDPSGFTDDEPIPQLDKISSELSDIDISDLVGASDSEEDDIPSLEPLSESDEELATLEPLDADDDIPEITPLDDVGAGDEFAPLSASSDSLDDLDLTAEDFDDDDLSSLIEESGLDDFDVGDETPEIVSSQEPQPLGQPIVTEPIDDLLTTPTNEPLSDLIEDEAGLSFSDVENEKNSEEPLDLGLADDQADDSESLSGYDLSFDEVGEDPLSNDDDGLVDLSLELEEDVDDQPLKTSPPPASPDIPDLGLTLESDQE